MQGFRGSLGPLYFQFDQSIILEVWRRSAYRRVLDHISTRVITDKIIVIIPKQNLVKKKLFL